MLSSPDKCLPFNESSEKMMLTFLCVVPLISLHCHWLIRLTFLKINTNPWFLAMWARIRFHWWKRQKYYEDNDHDKLLIGLAFNYESNTHYIFECVLNCFARCKHIWEVDNKDRSRQTRELKEVGAVERLFFKVLQRDLDFNPLPKDIWLTYFSRCGATGRNTKNDNAR